MIDELKLFRGKDYQVNDYINIHQPTLEEICDYGEQKYYSMVSTICATPSEYKVQLFDMGTDYEKISEFQFFTALCKGYKKENTSILFDDLDFSRFEPSINNENGDLILYDTVENSIIDELAYILITDYLRKIHGFVKHTEIAGNAITKQILIDEDRKEQERFKENKKSYESMLIPLISSMTNCNHFKYNHESVWSLPIYTFMDSVKRIQKIKNYDQLMQGAYAGCVDLKKIPNEQLNWLGNLDK